MGGACMVGSIHGGVYGRGGFMAGEDAWKARIHSWGCPWQERQPMQWPVHILLECILVILVTLIVSMTIGYVIYAR